MKAAIRSFLEWFVQPRIMTGFMILSFLAVVCVLIVIEYCKSLKKKREEKKRKDWLDKFN